MSGSSRLTLLLTALVGLLLSSFAVPLAARADDTTDPAPQPDPYVGAPTAGECSRMTLKQAFKESVSSETVACDTKHTTEVLAVGLLPDDVTWDDLDAAKKSAVDGCRSAWRERWGKDDMLVWRSFYQGFVFIPTADDRTAGARWYRCDLGLAVDGRLLTTKLDPMPTIGKTVPDTVGRCLTKGYDYTVCSKPHAWANAGAFPLERIARRDKRAEKQLRAGALEKCPQATKTDRWVWQAFQVKARSYVLLCYADSHQ